MPTITSGTTGLWSGTATWTGSVVPVDGDTVVIAAGHTVTFDVDQSAWATGINGLTITGTLSLSRTTGTYYMFMKTGTYIGGAGTFDCGTLASPIPFAAKHTITGGANWYIKGNDSTGLIVTVYAAEPTYKYILLSGDEAIGQTELSVDTDVTGDIWAVGDTVAICDINQAREAEARTIAAAGIAAGTITITAGLTAAKSTGAFVILTSRNVKFIGVTGAMMSYPNNLTIAGGSFTGSQINYGYLTISGGVFFGFSTLFNGSFHTVSGGVFTNSNNVFSQNKGTRISGGTFVGNAQVITNSAGMSIEGGLFAGNTSALNSTSAVILGGTFRNNTNGLQLSYAAIKNATFSANTYDLNNSYVSAYNTTFGSTTENNGYNELSQLVYSESIDHDATAGEYKAWTKGGITSSVGTPVPTGYTTAYQIACESATVPGYWQREVSVSAGASVNIEMWLQKSASMSVKPKAEVFLKSAVDPLAGGTALHTFTFSDDDIDTWESDEYSYTNTGAQTITLIVRYSGQNATGTVTTALTVDQINVDLTTALAALVAIQAKTDNLPADPADQSLLTASIAAIPAAPTAVAIRQEVDSNSTQLAAIKAKTDALPTDPADESLLEAAIAAIPAAPSVVDILAGTVEGAYTMKQALQIMLSVLAGEATGGGTTTITFRDVGDTANRVVATVDTDGNRSAVVLTV